MRLRIGAERVVRATDVVTSNLQSCTTVPCHKHYFIFRVCVISLSYSSKLSWHEEGTSVDDDKLERTKVLEYINVSIYIIQEQYQYYIRSLIHTYGRPVVPPSFAADAVVVVVAVVTVVVAVVAAVCRLCRRCRRRLSSLCRCVAVVVVRAGVKVVR